MYIFNSSTKHPASHYHVIGRTKDRENFLAERVQRSVRTIFYSWLGVALLLDMRFDVVFE